MARSLHSLLADWESAVKDSNLPQPPSYSGPDIYVTRLTEKTSEVVPGACFVARVRETSDGHPYIGAAAAAGASMILAQKPLSEIGLELPPEVVYLEVDDTAAALAWLSAAWEGFPSDQLLTIGITGTDGKTTTANLLLSILRAAGMRTGLLSTTRAVIGDEEEPLALHVTTPEAPVVQHYLRRMVNAGMTHCILEATSHGLAQHRVGAIHFDVAVITNITHEHLDYHGDYEAYAAAKSKLFEMVAADTWQTVSDNSAKRQQVKTSVLNRDDRSYAFLAPMSGAWQLTYGLEAGSDVSAETVHYTAKGTEFTLRLSRRLGPDGHKLYPVTSPLTGEFNVYNTLAAAAAALAVGAEPEDISLGLKELEPISGRMEAIELGQPFTVFVDFAHTPNALSQAIRAARATTKGRVITVFGSAGKRDISKRTRMAEISARDADLTILTAEDPRTDSLAVILETMASGSRGAGGIEGETFWRVPDRGRAIYFALSQAMPGDLVLICGKGHEQSMCFGTIEYPWDDRQATQKAWEALSSGSPMADLGLPTFEAGQS